jgi:hypothetical protein
MKDNIVLKHPAALILRSHFSSDFNATLFNFFFSTIETQGL